MKKRTKRAFIVRAITLVVLIVTIIAMACMDKPNALVITVFGVCLAWLGLVAYANRKGDY